MKLKKNLQTKKLFSKITRVCFRRPLYFFLIRFFTFFKQYFFAVDERGNVITVISENQLQNYEYIPLDTATEVEGQTIQTRDTLQVLFLFYYLFAFFF